MIAFDLLYNRLAESSLLAYVESVEYIDRVKSSASELVVKLCNADGRFTGGWAATLGDSLSLRFGDAAPETMAIRSVGVERAPRLVTWSCRSVPSASRAVSGRGGGLPPPSAGALVAEKKSWDTLRSVSLSSVASRVCAECGLSLRYAAKVDPVLSMVARYRETGYHLLERLCRMYGLGIRATADSVQIVARPSSRATSETVPQAVIPIPDSMIVTMQNLDSLPARAIQSARRDPRSGDVLRTSAGDGDGAPVALDFDALAGNAIYDDAMLNAAASELSVVPDARIVAGVLLQTSFGLREVTEMRYNRTGDAESMRLVTKGAT